MRAARLALLLALAASEAAAQDPFGGAITACPNSLGRAINLDTMCWYSTAQKKCICDVKAPEGGAGGGGTTPAVPGKNTKPALMLNKADKSLSFSFQDVAKDRQAKGQ